MHSHHSHSGDYVAHASDSLYSITNRAIELQFDTFCLTEHMPRLHNHFLYPEEVEQEYTVDTLFQKFDNYYQHARILQREHRDKGTPTKFLVGMEVEGLDLEHIQYAKVLRNQYPLDLVVGSVHYVRSIPIDFDRELLLKAKEACGNTWYNLFKDYFELQFLMLSEVQPEVVGHFDLLRLFIDDTDIDELTGFKVLDIDLKSQWPEIWELVFRNLKYIKSYGGLIELNGAAIRKGWTTPYPKLDIAREVIEHCDSRFCLSDDSHSMAQVGLNYDKVLEYVENVLQLKHIWYLNIDHQGAEKTITPKIVTLTDLKNNSFFKNK